MSSIEYLQLRAEATTLRKQVATTSGQEATVAAFSEKCKTSGLYGSTDEALTSMVPHIGAEYLQSYQGFDDRGDDRYSHRIVRWIQDGREVEIDKGTNQLHKLRSKEGGDRVRFRFAHDSQEQEARPGNQR